MEKLSYKIIGFGCKVNQYDAGSLVRELENLGFTAAEAAPSLVVINTCTVTQSAIKKDLKAVAKAKADYPGAKIAITGCLPVNYRAEALAAGVDFIAGVGEAAELIENIKEAFDAMPLGCNTSLTDQENHSRYFLKVQDGCRQFCSYCIIPYNRGELKSRTSQEVISEVREAVAAGYQEFILCGIHLGLYGVDLKDEKINLVELLEKILQIDGLGRIRLSSIEVTEVNDSLISLMKRDRRMCQHLHIPLQSGNDKILKSMNRPYDTKYFKERIDAVRASLPDVAVTTDVIVGFPGESEEDAMLTESFAREINFSKLHVFPYSAHKKTPAYSFPDQVEIQERKKRSTSLQIVSNELEQKYKNKFVGNELSVIVDGRSSGKKFRGKTEYYFDIVFESLAPLRVGEIVRVRDWNFC